MPSKKRAKARAAAAPALELDVVAPPTDVKKARGRSKNASAGVTKASTGKRKHKAKTSPKKITAKRGRPSKKEKAVADAIVVANAAAEDAAAAAAVAAAVAAAPANIHVPEMPKRRKDMSKEELDSLNAHFMRQNRRRHTMEKSVDDFHSITNGSMLLFTATSGGSFRGGRTYIHGSGRFGNDFVKASVSDVVKAARGSSRGIKHVTVGELFNILIDGSRHIASIKQSARAARNDELHVRSRKPTKKSSGKKTTKKASVGASASAGAGASASDSDADMSEAVPNGGTADEGVESIASDA